MSTEERPKKPREDDFRETPAWHRARAQGLRKSGFAKMAEEHEQIAQAIEGRRAQNAEGHPSVTARKDVYCPVSKLHSAPPPVFCMISFGSIVHRKLEMLAILEPAAP
jgi:hypothetical protein